MPEYPPEQTRGAHIAGVIGCLAVSLAFVALVVVGAATVIAFLKEVLG